MEPSGSAESRVARRPASSFHSTPHAPSEEQESRGEPVQPVDGAQVLEAVLLGQDEHHRVVAVAAARVDLDGWRRSNKRTALPTLGASRSMLIFFFFFFLQAKNSSDRNVKHHLIT